MRYGKLRSWLYKTFLNLPNTDKRRFRGYHSQPFLGFACCPILKDQLLSSNANFDPARVFHFSGTTHIWEAFPDPPPGEVYRKIINIKNLLKILKSLICRYRQTIQRYLWKCINYVSKITEKQYKSITIKSISASTNI